MTSRQRFFLCTAGFCLAVGFAQQPVAVVPAHAPLGFASPVQDKNFYLLSIMERTPEVKQAVTHSGSLTTIAKVKQESLVNAAQSCNLDLSCYANGMKWTEADISAVSDALR